MPTRSFQALIWTTGVWSARAASRARRRTANCASICGRGRRETSGRGLDCGWGMVKGEWETTGMSAREWREFNQLIRGRFSGANSQY